MGQAFPASALLDALLSIVLPAYNEEQNIPNTVKVLTGMLTENAIDYELVFVSTTSAPPRHSFHISRTTSGGCCRSQSMTTTASPAARDSPAKMAASFPKFRENSAPLTFGFSA